MRLALGLLVACGSPPEATVEEIANCEGRSAGICEDERGCTTVFARPLLDGCLDDLVPLEPVGCRADNQDCGFALTFATDGEDEVWWFPDECVPPTFTRFVEDQPGDCDDD